jgi:hypothetical protein
LGSHGGWTRSTWRTPRQGAGNLRKSAKSAAKNTLSVTSAWAEAHPTARPTNRPTVGPSECLTGTGGVAHIGSRQVQKYALGGRDSFVFHRWLTDTVTCDQRHTTPRRHDCLCTRLVPTLLISEADLPCSHPSGSRRQPATEALGLTSRPPTAEPERCQYRTVVNRSARISPGRSPSNLLSPMTNLAQGPWRQPMVTNGTGERPSVLSDHCVLIVDAGCGGRPISPGGS